MTGNPKPVVSHVEHLKWLGDSTERAGNSG
jgi:hypothetical protein